MLLNLFNKCMNAQYSHVENDGDYALEREDDTLYILLQWSHSEEDWRNNFDFPAEPYKDMPLKWKAHRGFVKVWKSIEPYLKEAILDPTIKQIYIVGYSHGGALAYLAHEYVWFNRPDIRNNIFGYGFGAPRVFHGTKIPEELEERWKQFYLIRNGEDIVTHLPPKLFGFKHCGTMIQIGQDRDVITPVNLVKKIHLKCVDEHHSDNIIHSLKKLN